MISVDFVGDAEEGAENTLGYEIIIPFYLWTIVVSIKELESNSAQEDITIYDQSGVDVTEEYFMFKETATIRPTGKNLYNVFDVLRTNLKEKGQ